MKLRWKILIGVGVLILLAILYPVLTHQQAKSALETYRKQLAAHGEKVTLGEVAPHLSAEERESARNLFAACAMLGSAVSNYPPLMHSVAAGHALVPWAEAELPTETSSNVWPGLRAQIQSHTQYLDAVRDALKQPVG